MIVNQTVSFGTVLEKSGDDQYIAGYASVFFDGTDDTQRYDGSLQLWERIAPFAFDKSIRADKKVEGRYNHSKDHVLGRTDLGTVSLATDRRGLRYRIKFDSTDPDHLKVAAKIKSGLIEGSSFLAHPIQWKFSKQGKDSVITYQEFELLDVGPVNHPGMQGTGQPILMSALDDELKEELDRWVRTQEILAR